MLLTRGLIGRRFGSISMVNSFSYLDERRMAHNPSARPTAGLAVT
jgi:hypothetical protein